MRGAWVFFCLAGLVAVSGAWLTAAVIALVRPDGHTCMTFGYARPDAWVLNVVVYSDGFVLAQHFHQNLTRYDGPYAKLSRADEEHAVTFRSLFPRVVKTRTTISAGTVFHLSPAILVFLLLCGHAVGWPLLRRRRRRKQGRCLRCGYDLRGAASPACTECGFVNAYRDVAK